MGNETIQESIIEKKEIDVGQILNWILTIALIGIVIYAIYNKWIYQPTCDCQGTYEQICNTINNYTTNISSIVGRIR